MDAVDAKQNGINHFHWNLIREQFGALARDNNALRQEMLAVANAVMKNEASRPTPRPASAGATPSRVISHRTCARPAPNACRMPISRLRHATEWDTIP